MATKFKYDIYTFIELVESKDCLWDKTKDESKNKILRKNAWREVCVFLEPNFENIEQKSKDEILSAVMSKWNNIRDAFMKSLKTKSGQAVKKKYIYSQNLQFLLKTLTPDETDSSIPFPSQNDSENRPESQQSTSHLDQSIRVPSPSTSTSTSTKSTNRTGTKRLNAVDAEILKAIRETPTQSELGDEDHAFMISLLPTVKRLNNDDKLEFRIEVMQLLRRFKNRRLSSSSSTIASPRDYGNFHQAFSPQQTHQYSLQHGIQQFSPQQDTLQFSPHQEIPQFSSEQETPQFSPHQETPQFSPHQENPQFSSEQDTPQFSSELETPQILPQQDIQAVIQSITQLLSQDFSTM